MLTNTYISFWTSCKVLFFNFKETQLFIWDLPNTGSQKSARSLQASLPLKTETHSWETLWTHTASWWPRRLWGLQRWVSVGIWERFGDSTVEEHPQWGELTTNFEIGFLSHTWSTQNSLSPFLLDPNKDSLKLYTFRGIVHLDQETWFVIIT